MRLNSLLFPGFVLASALILLPGCGRKEQFGVAVTPSDAVKVADVLTSPSEYDGKTVTLKGTIATECPAGCWFELKQDKAVLHVDLSGAGIAIPQRVKSKVIVKGKIAVDGRRPTLMGEGIEIR
jgi:hypothetical protein